MILACRDALVRFLDEFARKLREILERAGPAVLMRARGLFGREARMDEDHLGLVAAFIENHGDLGVRLRLEAVALPSMGEDET